MAPENASLAAMLELRSELKKVGDLRVSVDANTEALSKFTDELTRNRFLQEDARDVMRELRDASVGLARAVRALTERIDVLMPPAAGGVG